MKRPQSGVSTPRAFEQLQLQWPGWKEGMLRNILETRDEISRYGSTLEKVIRDHLRDSADSDAKFDKSGPEPPAMDEKLPFQPSKEDELMCGKIGSLDPAVCLAAGVSRILFCTNRPGHRDACSCQAGTLILCDQGICIVCQQVTPKVDNVRPDCCANCGATLVATEAKEYQNPWISMKSDPTQAALSASGSGSGKEGKKGSRQEASSASAATVLAPPSFAKLLQGIAVTGENALQNLGCASIVFATKDEEGRLQMQDRT